MKYKHVATILILQLLNNCKSKFAVMNGVTDAAMNGVDDGGKF